MTEQKVDLKQLILRIKESKDFEANLILNEGCTLYTQDTTPLIKVLNYIINYMNQLTEKPLEISLDMRSSDFLLIVMAYTEKSDLPDLSDQLDGALKDYNATLEKLHEAGKYLQLKLSFAKPD
jgi:hypothetical protein